MYETARQSAKSGICFPAKSSRASRIEVRGKFVTPQNTETSPRAAPKAGESPRREETAQPKVALVKKPGTISPPLKPAPRVTVVKMIFSRKA